MAEITEHNLFEPNIEIQKNAGTPEIVVLRGPWTLQELANNFDSLRAKLKSLANHPALCWDLREVTALDRVGALLLWQIWGKCRPKKLRLQRQHESLLAYWETVQHLPPQPHWQLPNPFKILQKRLVSLFDHLLNGITLLGQLVLDMGYLVSHPRQIPWRETSAMIHRAGGRALSITAFVGLLIGVVMSYLSILQLQQYGAQEYLVYILGLFIIREIGPLLAAILVAGRSGSAITAELGVMRVTQELDALTALGISHTRRLVLPKVIALIITLPLLIVWTNAIALLGGFLSAQFALGLGLWQFLAELPAAVPIANFWISLGKGGVFGALIAFIACHYGLRIQPDTQNLATETTNSVVTAITLVILVDAVFAILFWEVGLP
jgi:phospholipid/cholesterol/gamma-HCH transport system permease protein